MSERQLNLAVYLGLVSLLALTVGLAFLPLGAVGPWVALLIAALKAVLIGAFFMKLKEASASLRVMALGALFWVLILFAISLGDYLTRNLIGVPGK